MPNPREGLLWRSWALSYSILLWKIDWEYFQASTSDRMWYNLENKLLAGSSLGAPNFPITLWSPSLFGSTRPLDSRLSLSSCLPQPWGCISCHVYSSGIVYLRGFRERPEITVAISAAMLGNHILNGQWTMEFGRFDNGCHFGTARYIEIYVSHRDWSANFMMESLSQTSDFSQIQNMLEIDKWEKTRTVHNAGERSLEWFCNGIFE